MPTDNKDRRLAAQITRIIPGSMCPIGSAKTKSKVRGHREDRVARKVDAVKPLR
jgi:hypothetical protein